MAILPFCASSLTHSGVAMCREHVYGKLADLVNSWIHPAPCVGTTSCSIGDGSRDRDAIAGTLPWGLSVYCIPCQSPSSNPRMGRPHCACSQLGLSCGFPFPAHPLDQNPAPPDHRYSRKKLGHHGHPTSAKARRTVKCSAQLCHTPTLGFQCNKSHTCIHTRSGDTYHSITYIRITLDGS